MEFGEMKRNTSNWSNFGMLLRRAGLTASAGLSWFVDNQSIGFTNFRRHRWQAISNIAIDFTIPWSVSPSLSLCLSRSCIVPKKPKDIDTISFAYDSPMSPQTAVKLGLQLTSFPNVAVMWPTPIWAWETFDGNFCSRVVIEIAQWAPWKTYIEDHHRSFDLYQYHH